MAFYWLRETQKSQCAPCGAGIKRDREEYEQDKEWKLQYLPSNWGEKQRFLFLVLVRSVIAPTAPSGAHLPGDVSLRSPTLRELLDASESKLRNSKQLVKKI